MIKRSPLPPRKNSIQKSGPTKAKKILRLKKHYSSSEYKAARDEQVVVSQGQCEARHLFDESMGLYRTLLPGEEFIAKNSEKWFISRCPTTEGLEFHEIHYGSTLGLIRPIKGVMLCRPDHHSIEMIRHPTRQRKWA